jgi:dihydroorotate dehydrogenase (NAD+) catalytic subunit
MIELAPNRKQGLPLPNPLIAASGSIGFGGEAADLIALGLFGALVTAPISLRPRRGSTPPRMAATPGGMLLQTGEQNPGWRRVVEQHGGAWARSRAPVIAHIIGHTSLGELARRAEAARGIAGLEFDLESADSLPLLAALRRATELPILVRLPYGGAALAVRAVQAGADALVCIVPPRAAAPLSAGGQIVEGRLFGPLVRAMALQALRDTLAATTAGPRVVPAGTAAAPPRPDGVRESMPSAAAASPLPRADARAEGEELPPAAVPLIACGGVHSADDVAALLAAGASAVMLDSLAWVAPRALNALLARDYGQSK